MQEPVTTAEDLVRVMIEPITQNDRGAAITAGSLLEHSLQRAIEAKWPPISNRIRAEIFDNEGPLATFGAKIKIGYAMGLYSPEIKADLDRIRRIRNYFAHTMRPLTFCDVRIKKLCGDLGYKKEQPIPEIPDDRMEEYLKANPQAFSFERAHFHLNAFYLTGLMAHISGGAPMSAFEDLLEKVKPKT